MKSSSSFVATLAPATIVAAALFTVSWIVLGRVSPGFTLFGDHVAPYNWVAQPVSGLGLGKTAAAMNAAFILTGALTAVGLIGVLASLPTLSSTERTLFGVILLLSPLGTAICGVFTLEQFLPHFAGFFLAMGMPVLGFFALGWRLRHDATHGWLGHMLIAAALVTLVLLVVSLWSFDPEASGRGVGVAGLTQRILITEVLGVFAILGWSVRTARAL